MTNVQRDGRPVKPPTATSGAGAGERATAGGGPGGPGGGPARPEVIEIGGLLAELIRTGYLGRGGASEAGPTGVGAGAPGTDGRPPSADGGTGAPGAGTAGQATGGASVPVAPQVIRAAVHIHEQGPQTIGQLAAGLGISQGWASRIVDDLERAGYVERARDPDDRRVVRVDLTPMAVERVEKAARWQGDAVAAALAGLSPDERAAVVTFLRRFLERSRPGG